MSYAWCVLSVVLRIDLGGDSMAEAFSVVIEDLILYNNSRYLYILFLVALIFLWFTEKDRKLKTVLIYLSAALVVVFVCPIYAWIGQKIDEQIYYRVFWSVPVGILVCYAAVRAIQHFKRLISRIIIGIMIVLVIIGNGKLVYTNTLHFKSSNPYHIPQVVMDVADAIKMEKYTPIAVLPAELLPFLRQYSCDILTPYGRNMLEKQWDFSNALYDAMEAEVYDTQEIALRAREEHCAYVVLSSAKEQKGSLEDNNYFLKDFVGGYYIYMDNAYYEVYKEQGLLDEEY